MFQLFVLKMLEFIKFIFATIGLTLIITKSKLFEPFRNWCLKKSELLGYLTKCPLCIGFWSGLLVFSIEKIYIGDFIIYSFIGSFVSYVGYLILYPLFEKYD